MKKNQISKKEIRKQYENLLELPPELLLHCFSFLNSPKALISLSKTNHKIRRIALDQTLWHELRCLPAPDCSIFMQKQYPKMFNNLVALNNGYLASWNKECIFIFETDMFKCLHSFKLSSVANIIVALPDNRLAIGCSNGTIEIWSLDFNKFKNTKNKLKRFRHLINKPHIKCYREQVIEVTQCNRTEWCYGVKALATLPKGLLASSVCCEGKIHIWDTSNGECIQKLAKHNYQVTALVGLATGELVSGSGGRPNIGDPIRIWDLKSGKCVQTLQHNCKCADPEDSRVQALVVLPQGYLACSRFETTVKVWDLKSGRFIREIYTRPNRITVLTTGQLVTWNTHRNDYIRIWDIVSGKYIHNLEMETPDPFRWNDGDMAVLDDGKLVVGNYFNQIHAFRFIKIPENKLTQHTISKDEKIEANKCKQM